MLKRTLLSSPAFQPRGTRKERIDILCRCKHLHAYHLSERVFCVCDGDRTPDCSACPVRIRSADIPEKQLAAWEAGRAKAIAVNQREKAREWGDGNVDFPSVGARSTHPKRNRRLATVPQGENQYESKKIWTPPNDDTVLTDFVRHGG